MGEGEGEEGDAVLLGGREGAPVECRLAEGSALRAGPC